MLEITKRLKCRSSFASKDAAVEISQYSLDAIWIEVWQTRGGEPVSSEPIKVTKADLLALLEHFR